MTAHSAQRPWLREVKAGERQEEPSDSELIDAILRGDAQIAGAIHDRLIRVVDHTLFRVLGRREHDHDDLIQSCFEQIIRSLGRGRFAQSCSLHTWAARITTHVALNEVRSRARERRVIHRPEVTPDVAPSSTERPAAETSAEMDRVRRALAKMKPLNAEVLILHEVHGYQIAEIADLTELSLSATQSRLVRARSELELLLSAPKARAKTGPFGGKS